MSKSWKIVLVVVLVLLAGASLRYWKHVRGALPAFGPPLKPSFEIIPGVNETGIPLTIPDNISISTLTREVPGARVIVQDKLGNLWVSQPSEGTVSLIELNRADGIVGVNPVLRDLNHPHGLAFDPSEPFVLYIAEEHQISRVPVYSDAPVEKVVTLPEGGRHINRSISFGSDGRLYISIASSCDVCVEDDALRGTVQVVDIENARLEEYADGLRNAAFHAWHPRTRQLWATGMGRDNLGDDLPPDEINIVRQGLNYGWPYCYGDRVYDTDFEENASEGDRCESTVPSHIELPAHVSPLGLAFVPSSWPAPYAGNLFVAMHGSWNRTKPIGYGLLHIELGRGDEDENQEMFIDGWLEGDRSYGRPVDLLFGSDDSLYVTDDKSGAVYLIKPN